MRRGGDRQDAIFVAVSGMLACLVLAMLKPEKFCFTRQRTWLDPVVRPVERLSTS